MQRVSHIPLEVGIRSEINSSKDWVLPEQINADFYEIVSLFEPTSKQIITLAILACPIRRRIEDQEAAKLVVQAIVQTFEQADSPLDYLALLRQGFVQANMLLQNADNDIGISCSAIVVIGRQFFFASYGGNRIFLVRNEQVYHVSASHSFLDRLIDLHYIAPESIYSRPIDGSFPYFHLGAGVEPHEHLPDFRLRLGLGMYIPQESIGITLSPTDQIIMTSSHIF